MNSERRLTLTRGGFLRRSYSRSWNRPNTKDYATRDKYTEQSSAERHHCSAVATPTLRAAQTCSLYGLYAKHILVQIYSLYIQYNIVGCASTKIKTRKTRKFSIRESLVPQKLRSIRTQKQRKELQRTDSTWLSTCRSSAMDLCPAV